MSLVTSEEIGSGQEWLAPIEEGLQKAVSSAYSAGGSAGRKVEDALHGTWLGHPLHPVLTDVPIGAWTVTVALDAADAISGNDHNARGADAALLVGLVGAAGAAAAGLTDWHKTDGGARRTGVIHGLLNIGATALFAASLVLRRRRRREAAQLCSLAGYLVAGTSAYLGGNLVYGQRIGVDHAQREPIQNEFQPVYAEADLPEGKMARVEVQGVRILLARANGRIYAIGETCSHLGGPLSEGSLEGGGVRCPWHGSCFALSDGHVLEGPSTYPQPRYDVRVKDGQIEVRSFS